MMTPLLLPCTSLKWWGLQTARYLSKLTAMMRKMLLQTLILKKKLKRRLTKAVQQQIEVELLYSCTAAEGLKPSFRGSIACLLRPYSLANKALLQLGC